MWKMVCGAPHWDASAKKMWSPGPPVPREPVKLPFLEVTPTTVLQRIRDRSADAHSDEDDRSLALWTTDPLDLSRTAPNDLGGYRGVYLGKLRQGSSYSRGISVEKGYTLLPNKYATGGLGSARGERPGSRSPGLVSPTLPRRINALAPLEPGDGLVMSRAGSTRSVIPPLSAVSRRSIRQQSRDEDIVSDPEEDEDDDEEEERSEYDSEDDDEEIEEEEVEEVLGEEGRSSRPKSSATTRDSGISIFSVSNDGELLTENGSIRDESRQQEVTSRASSRLVQPAGASPASSIPSANGRNSYEPAPTRIRKAGDVKSPSSHSLPNDTFRSNGFGIVGKGYNSRSRNSTGAEREFRSFDYESDFETDEDDPHNVTLSNATLTKMKLLKKKRENQREIERRRAERDTKRTQEERTRKYRELELQHSGNSLEPSRASSGDADLAVRPNLSYKGKRSPRPSPRHTSRMSKSKSYTSSLNRTQGREALAEKRHRSLERSLPQSNGVASNAYRTPQLVRRGQPPVNSGSSLSNSFGTTRRTPRRPPVRVVTKAEVPEASSVNVPPGYKPRKPVPSEKPSPVGSQRPRLKHHLAAQFSTDSTRSVDDMSSTMSSVGLRTAKPASSCFKAHLEPFPNPHEALKRAQDLVNSGDWESQVEGITNIVRLAEHHPEVLQSDLHQINMGLLKQAKNLRSQVSRASIQAFTLLFDVMKRNMEPDVEKITSLLLQKTSDTNKFLQLDSNHGLDALVENVSPNKAIPAILQEGLNHKNPAVRTTVARLLTYEVERLGASKVLSGQKDITDRLLPAAAKLAQEGSLETRKYAKHIFQQLSQQGNYDQALKKYVSPNDLRNIQKFLDNLSNEGRTIRESARSKFSVGSRYTRTM